jgi:hypothetical protein
MNNKMVLTVVTLVLTYVISAVAHDKEPDPADFPTQFRVSNTVTFGSWAIGNFCTMVLIDPAAPNVMLGVNRHRYGGKCQVADAGTTIPGRRVKQEIELLMKDEKGKLRVERWSIASTVAVPPVQKPNP